MIDTKALREKVLDLAIRGKLVPQDPNDEPASVLLERIRAEKEQMVKDGKLKAKDIKNDTIIFKGDDNLHYEQFPDGTVKYIEDEIPFELPEGWLWCRLSNLICLYSGQDLTPTQYNDKANGIPYVTGASNIENGKVIINRWTEFPTTHATKGDLLLSCKGTVGEMAWCEYDDVHIARQFMALRSLKGLYNKYLKIVVSAELVNITSKVNGLIPGISRETILNTVFPFPPYDEQKRIYDKCKEILTIITNTEIDKNDLAYLISKTKSKILDLAIRGKLVPQNPDDEPAAVLLERIRAEKEELIKAGKIKRDKKESVIFKGEDNSYYRTNGKTTELCDDIPFDLPEGWAWVSLGQYCEKVTDQVASGSFAALRENVVSLKEPSYALMVKTADFSNGFTKNLTYTDKHGYEFLENSNLFGGELILSNIGSIGKVFIVPDLNCKMTLAPNSVMIRLTNNEYRDYLYYFLQSPTGYEELEAISTGVAMLKFNKTDLKTIYLPLPPLTEQKRIVEAIEIAFAQLDEILNSIS